MKIILFELNIIIKQNIYFKVNYIIMSSDLQTLTRAILEKPEEKVTKENKQ